MWNIWICGTYGYVESGYVDQCLQPDLSFSLLDPGKRCGRGEVRFLTIIIFTNPIIIMIMISIIDKNFFKLFKEEEEGQYMEEQVAEVTTEGTGFVDHRHHHHNHHRCHHHHLHCKSNKPYLAIPRIKTVGKTPGKTG